MIELDLKALLKRMNPYCTRSLENAAGMCVSRGNYEVTLEHLLLKLIEDPSRDFQLILRHFEIDPARVEKSIQHAVEQGKTGNSGKPVFSPLLIELVEDAWLIATVPQRGISYLQPGDKAQFALEMYPGKVFEAEVENVAWAAGSSPPPSRPGPQPSRRV